MELVIVESPFKPGPGTPAERVAELRRNITYARRALRDCFKRNEAPFASHLLYTQDGVLDDENPEERALGIEAGLLWAQGARKSVVYVDLGVSDGMCKGITRAQREQRIVEFRTLENMSADSMSKIVDDLLARNVIQVRPTY